MSSRILMRGPMGAVRDLGDAFAAEAIGGLSPENASVALCAGAQEQTARMVGRVLNLLVEKNVITARDADDLLYDWAVVESDA